MGLLLMENLKDSSKLTVGPFTLSQQRDILRTKLYRSTLLFIMKMISVSTFILCYRWNNSFLLSVKNCKPFVSIKWDLGLHMTMWIMLSLGHSYTVMVWKRFMTNQSESSLFCHFNKSLPVRFNSISSVFSTWWIHVSFEKCILKMLRTDCSSLWSAK